MLPEAVLTRLQSSNRCEKRKELLRRWECLAEELDFPIQPELEPDRNYLVSRSTKHWSLAVSY